MPGVSIVAGLASQDLGAGIIDNTEGLALQVQNGVTKLLIANRTPDGHFGVARLLPSGQPDPSFGSGGIVQSNFGNNDDADAVSLTPDGSTILVTGTSAAGNSFSLAVAAFKATDGSVDASFNTDGQLTVAGSLPVDPGTTATAAAAAGTVCARTRHNPRIVDPGIRRDAARRQVALRIQRPESLPIILQCAANHRAIGRLIPARVDAPGQFWHGRRTEKAAETYPARRRDPEPQGWRREGLSGPSHGPG